MNSLDQHSDSIQILIKIIPQIFTWILVLIGWAIVNQQNNNRETRKEKRSAIDKIIAKIEEIEESAIKFHTSDFCEESIRSIETEITRISRKISSLNIVEKGNQTFVKWKHSIDLKNSNESDHKICKHDDTLVLDIKEYSLDLLDVLENSFSSAYKDIRETGKKTKLIEKFKKIMTSIYLLIILMVLAITYSYWFEIKKQRHVSVVSILDDGEPNFRLKHLPTYSENFAAGISQYYDENNLSQNKTRMTVEIKPTATNVKLFYMHSPSDIQDVENDTKIIARSVLRQYMAEKTSPSDENIKVQVTAHFITTGETGKNIVKTYGQATYNPTTDSLDFTRD